MAQPEMLRKVHVVTDRENTSYGNNSPTRYNHSTVVERGVLEEYILYQAGIDVGVDYVAGLLVVVERHLPLEAYERTCL